MKKHLALALLSLLARPTFGATWTIDLQDANTHEVRHFEYTEEKPYKLELTSFKHGGCLLTLTLTGAKVNDLEFQKAEILCIYAGGSVEVRKACSTAPTDYDKAVPTIFQIVEDWTKVIPKQKGESFRSYLVTLKCK